MNENLYSTDFTTIGYLLFLIAAMIIGLFLVVTFISFITKREIVKNQMRILFISFIVALSVWALLWDPAPYYDSYKHFQWLDQIRAQNLTLYKFLKDGFEGSRTGNYHGLIFFNILRYIIVRISSNNHVLPFVCTIIDYFIFYYIVIDFFSCEKLRYTWMFALWTMCFSFMSYFMVVSGIRNTFAASVSALAIYRRIYKKSSLVEYAILSFIAVTTHPNVILPLMIALIYRYIGGYKCAFVLLSGIVFLKFGTNILKSSSIYFLSYIGGVIEFYLVDFQYHGEIITFIADIVVIVCLLLMLYHKNNKKYLYMFESSEEYFLMERYLKFCKVYLWVLLALAFVGSTNFLTRGSYVLGFLSVFFIKAFSKIKFSLLKHENLNTILLITIIVVSLINIGHEFLLLLAQFF